MAAETLSIASETRDRLRELAQAEGRQETEVLDAAVDAYYRRTLLAGMAADYARLRSDPDAWAEELAERKLWDQTLADGVEADERG